jgi:hypothetical protein
MPINPPSNNRLLGKTASDAFKQGNNAGMLYKKEAKAAQTTSDHVKALTRLRQAEQKPNGTALRQWYPNK